MRRLRPVRDDVSHVNATDEHGNNALLCAALTGREDGARVLLEAGSRVQPLAFTMAARYDASMLALLDSMAPLDVNSRLAARLLDEARRSNPKAFDYLVKRGVPN